MGSFGVSAAVWARLSLKGKELVLEGNLYDAGLAVIM